MGIFNDEWENEVYRLKARVKELEKENKSLREQLIQQKIQTLNDAIIELNYKQFQCGYGNLTEKESEQE